MNQKGCVDYYIGYVNAFALSFISWIDTFPVETGSCAGTSKIFL